VEPLDFASLELRPAKTIRIRQSDLHRSDRLLSDMLTFFGIPRFHPFVIHSIPGLGAPIIAILSLPPSPSPHYPQPPPEPSYSFHISLLKLLVSTSSHTQKRSRSFLFGKFHHVDKKKQKMNLRHHFHRKEAAKEQ
jgi:hypothetical protein